MFDASSFSHIRRLQLQPVVGVTSEASRHTARTATVSAPGTSWTPAPSSSWSAFRSTSGTVSVNSAQIPCAVPEILARERKQVRSAGNGIVVGEVRKTTTVSLSTRMNSACASQTRPRSDSHFLRNAPTDGHTNRQTD